MDKFRQAGKTIVDSGSRAMLKTDIVFLEREIKSRKQRFGIEVYELMEQLETDTSNMSMQEKEKKIRLAFDSARKDIAVIKAKIDCKKDELEEDASNATSNIPPSTGNLVMCGHPSDRLEEEYGNLK